MAVEVAALRIISQHPDAGVLVAFGLYLGYEIRFGKLNQIQEEQREAHKERRIIGIALYKVIRNDSDLDEREFRELLWGDGEEIFPRDLSVNLGEDDPPKQKVD